MPATIRDVARHAGVSRQTVSRVVNGSEWVAPATRDRVNAAIEVLGYRRNALAGSLRNGRTRTIGLLISNILNPLFAAEARGVQDVADARGYQVIIANTDEDSRKEARLVHMLIGQQVDGVIAIPSSAASRVVMREFVQASVPIVLLNRPIPEFDCAVFDTFHGTQQAIQHLIDQGHHRIAIVSLLPRSPTARERLTAYKRTLARNGVQVDPALMLSVGFDEEAGTAATEELLDLPDPPTAIFATTVPLMLGVLRTVKSARLRIPDDVALVGCNEAQWACFVEPPLTIVEADAAALGRAAADLLFRRMEGHEPGESVTVRLATSLEVRESSGPPARSQTTVGPCRSTNGL